VTAVLALIPGLPFAAAVAGLLGSRWPRGRAGRPDPAARRRAAWFAIAPLTGSAVLTLWLAGALSRGTRTSEGFWAALLPGRVAGAYPVIDTGSLPITLSLQADGLSVLTGGLVVVIALAVQVYSVGYMRDDPRYPSYTAFISLFTSAMLLVVYAGDLILLYVGWEVMGLCSYLLIGHWWEDRANSRAAIKAFLVTRLGDVGFLFGIFTLGTAAGSFRIDDVLRAGIPEGTLILGTLLLLAGVAGKSAQVPLQTWLPDAMAGPTPISALIHAATMVAAGIFVIARLYPLFLGAGPTLDALAVIAALGMLGAALAALAQDDLKRVLAYSTISQLAVMAAALAAGSDQAAIFHLLTHGGFKALLFLCAGVVIHHAGSNLLGRMGGLRTALPITFVTMTIGFAALAGLPPASGFFSKDAVLTAIADGRGALRPVLFASALLTAGVTGAYATRAWLRAFFGPARAEPGAGHPPESGGEAPGSMLWPLVALAVPSLLFGFALPAFGGAVHGETAALGQAAALLGIGAVWWAWRRDPEQDPARLLGPLRGVCERGFHVDAVYAALVTRPVLRLAGGVGRADVRVIDRAVRGVGGTVTAVSRLVRLAQTGNAQLYLTGLLAGALLIAVAAVMSG